jgi:hypothetical protein
MKQQDTYSSSQTNSTTKDLNTCLEEEILLGDLRQMSEYLIPPWRAL